MAPTAAAVRRMMRLAERSGKLNHVPHFAKLPENNVRTGFFTTAEYRKLLAVLPDRLKAVVGIAFWTGLRAGEVFQLRWEQVDFFERVIRLDSTQTKNSTSRNVPMSSELFALLQAHRLIAPKDFEFVAFKTGPVQMTEIPSRLWKRCCKDAGLPGRRFHDLRRSAVRHLVRAGVPETVCMRISGHKTRSVFERYNIVSERDLLDAGRKLEHYIAQQTSSEVGASSGQTERREEQQKQPN